MMFEVNPAIQLTFNPDDCLTRKQIEDLIPELRPGSFQYITRGLGIHWAIKEPFEKGFRYKYTPDVVDKIKAEVCRMRSAQ